MAVSHRKPTSKAFQDLTGRKFGQLKVLQWLEQREDRRSFWLCLCDCGRHSIVSGAHLVGGRIKTCGHVHADRLRRGNYQKTHGQTGSPTYICWQAMLNRCRNHKMLDYYRYGGRGIKVCDRWKSFENFIADMGKRPSKLHSIERHDNDGNYQPGNCRWALALEQMNNRRTTRFLTLDGETLPLADWARRLGTTHRRIHARLRNGWSAERALTEPIPELTISAKRKRPTRIGETPL